MIIKSAISKISVIIADPQELIRKGLSGVLAGVSELELAGETDNFEDLLRLTRKLAPNIILLELNLSCGNITERIPEILSLNAATKILVLTSIEDQETLLRALQQGAIGIVNKNYKNNLLLQAIYSAHAGQAWIDRSITTLMWKCIAQTSTENPSVEIEKKLTPRENNVVRLAAKGWAAKKIANELYLSEKTVRNQLSSIYDKLGVNSQLELLLLFTGNDSQRSVSKNQDN